MIDARNDDGAPCERRWDASVELELERQIGLNWCWAAVAKGIVEHYGGPIRKQCQYATKFLRQRDTCCGADVPAPRCDLPHDVDTVLAHYGVYAAPPYHRPVRLDTLRRELERDRPVIALIAFPKAVHAVAITAVDAANRRIGFCDPWNDPKRRTLDADTFSRAYDKDGRWFYTILTRPAAAVAPRAKISFLRDRFARDEQRTFDPGAFAVAPESLEIDMYEADVEQLASGTGLQTAEPFVRALFRFDVADDGSDAALDVDRDLTTMREDIEARLDRGFTMRIVRCFAIKFQALWFTDPADTSRRTDHYIPIGRIPYYLEAGREYRAAELREILAEAARSCLPAVEIDRRFVERLARETAFHVDDPTV